MQEGGSTTTRQHRQDTPAGNTIVMDADKMFGERKEDAVAAFRAAGIEVDLS